MNDEYKLMLESLEKFISIQRETNDLLQSILIVLANMDDRERNR